MSDLLNYNIDINKLSSADKLALLELLTARDEVRKKTKINSYYPDEGALRRELYPKHIKYFEMGAKKRERCFMAANRIGKCLTINSYIDTPKGKKSLKELYEKQEPFTVLSYDEDTKEIVHALASPPFKKEGLHECYRITMADGQQVEVADQHRILTSAGWQFFEHLYESSVFHPQSNSEFSLTAHALDDLHLSETPQDCQDDYFEDCHPYGGLLHYAQGNALVSPPLQDDVLQHDSFLSDSDGQENKYTNNVQLRNDHLSTQDDLHRFLALSSEFLSRGVCKYDRQLYDLYLKFQHICVGVKDRLQSFSLSFQQFLDLKLQPLDLTPVFIDGNSIIDVKPIGLQEVYDFTVPTYHNYIAADMVHHNTEGVGLLELTYHMTGLYPDWWKGKRFDNPVKCWAAGDTSKTVRDILQAKLLGPPGEYGTGLIPKDCILKTTSRAGIADAVEDIRVQHPRGISYLTLKSYDQRRESFQGTEQDIILLDEEPPQDIYDECLIRTMTTNGLIMLTFTPLQGLTGVVTSFMPGGKLPTDEEQEKSNKFIIQATWDDVPHLSKEQKDSLWESIPPHMRESRAKGIPQLGSGAIYPVSEDEVLCEPFEIPHYWPRCYGMDVGWNRTAVIWLAHDRENDIVYAYSEYYRGQAEPAIHAQAINARGHLPGVIDPASRGRSQNDGSQLSQIYMDLGLELQFADNAVEAGIYDVWSRLSTGRLKIFNTLQNFIQEFRIYRRDDNGKVVKENDHLMDATRYGIRSGLAIASIERPDMEDEFDAFRNHYDNTLSSGSGY